MAGGIFAVFDDIAALLDDAAVMSKVAAKKTAGILGDDLAVNAEKASGFAASRELPVLWAISKGSILNKIIILPVAFLLSAFAPWIIVPILMLGGIYLSFEGAEKIYEYFFPHEEKKLASLKESFTEEEILAHEAKKIKSAILTDFILSIEIVIIALGTVIEQALFIQVVVVSVVALLATVGVYGIVVFIVRMDDIGFKIIELAGETRHVMRRFGEILVQALPKVIKSLTVIGTIAMLLVAGGIFVHNVHQIHDALHFMPSILAELLVGLVVGATALLVEKSFLKVKHHYA
jgi:predicted DNA repair protein MutK